MIPKISVIVPVYNSERCISKCIESILSQTFNNFELLLVDDGSTDNSCEICTFYSNIDERVKVIKKQNGGVSSARNLGLKNSVGQYISFIDSDDWVSQFFLESLYKSIIEKDSDFSMCGYYRVFHDRKKPYGINISKRLLEREYIENCLIKNVIYETEKINGLYSVWNKLYKRSFIGKLKFDESRRTGEDWWFNLYLLDKANSIAVVNEPLYYYSINANKKSLSKEFYTDRIWELVGKYHDFLDFFKKYNILETDINTNRLKVIINELVKARLNLTDKAFKMYLAEVVKIEVFVNYFL